MRVPSRVALVLTLVAGLAQAQGFGLDLSNSEGLGLDLTGPELRPSAAVVGGVWGDAPAPDSFDASLVDALDASARFSKVMNAGEVATALPDPEAARTCADDVCAAALADALDVDLLFLSHSDSSRGEPLSLIVYSRDTRGLERIALGNAVSRRTLASGARDQLHAILEPATPLRALIKLTANVEGASVRYGQRELGAVAPELRVAPIPDILRISHPGYRTFELELSPSAGETIEVDATLEVERPPEVAELAPVPEVQASSSGTPLYERPGFLMVLAGVAAVGLGFGIGAAAKSVEGRAVDANADGVLDITRAEALGAQRNAVFANVLVAGGLAVAGGGAAWLVLAPTVTPATSASGATTLHTGLVLAGGF